MSISDGSSTRLVLVPMAIAALMMLVGCVPSADPGPSNTPVSSPSSTPTPTPTPDLSDPANWVVGFGSVGPLRLGEPVAAAQPLLSTFEVSVQDACPWLTIARRPDLVIWIIQGGDDVIDLIAIGDAQPPGEGALLIPTEAGVSLGSTEAEVLAAYPGIAGVEGKYDTVHYSTVDDSGNYINFSVQNSSGVVVTILTSSTPDIPGEYCG